MNTTSNRFTITAATARPGGLGATAQEYAQVFDVAHGSCLGSTWSVIESGGARLGRTRDGVTTIVTRLGDLDLAHRMIPLLAELTRGLPEHLAPLALEANGALLDLPRLGRHIWATGTDPWNLPGSATGLLAELAGAAVDLPDPVRAALGDVVFAAWDLFGPALVPAKLEWQDRYDRGLRFAAVELGAALVNADDGEVIDLVETGLAASDFVEPLVDVDEATANIFETYYTAEGVWAHLDDEHLPALRSWVAVNRPHLLAEVDDLLS